MDSFIFNMEIFKINQENKTSLLYSEILTVKECFIRCACVSVRACVCASACMLVCLLGIEPWKLALPLSVSRICVECVNLCIFTLNFKMFSSNYNVAESKH